MIRVAAHCYCLILLCLSNTISAKTLLEDEVSRLNYANEKYINYLKNNNLLYNDKDVTDYLNIIMDKLYPEYKNLFQIHIYNSCEINASATVKGHVFLNLGILAKAENEAQIASVLAHEGAHIVKNHPLKGMQNRKHIVSGADFYGKIKTLQYLSDYSVRFEQEADDEGFGRLIDAKYNPKEAVNIFQLMLDEVKIRYQVESSLYSSHPKLMDRITYFTELSKGGVFRAYRQRILLCQNDSDKNDLPSAKHYKFSL